MVSDLLRPAQSRLGTGGDLFSLVRNSLDNHAVSSTFKDRLDVAHAIPGVGQLRSRVELWLLVSEPLSHLNPPIFTCCKQWIFATQYRQK